jgi:PAS domain S-box-containing protein
MAVNKPPRLIPVGRSLSFIVVIFVGIVACLLLLNNVRSEILSGIRAYVGGEGLYSKGQKDAVHYLIRYAHSQADRDYQKYLAALAVPLGDKKARLELEKENPDLGVAAQGFIEGRNHPEDLDGMNTMFRRFRHVSYMDKAISVWAQGDALIFQLQQLGDELHRLVASGHADAERTGRILEEIDVLNERLTGLEDEFSHTLGAGSRWLERRLLQITYAATVLLVVAGVVLSSIFLRQATAADHALRTQAERWRVTLASIGDGVLVTSDAATVVSLNAVAEALTGWSEKDAVGKPLDEVLRMRSETTGESVENPARRALRDGVVVGLGSHPVLLAKDGTQRPIDDSAAPIKDDLGTIVGAVLVFRDVSERRRADEALRRSEERHRVLVAATTSVLWTTDARGAFVAPQPAWERYTGQTWDEHRGQGWIKALHPDDRARVQEQWAQARSERATYENEGRVWHAASARYRYCVARAVPLLEHDRSVREWIGTLTDIDDRKRAEADAAAHVREQEAIARLGETALSGGDLQALMDEAVSYVARILNADLCAIEEPVMDGTQLRLQAGVGWKPGLVGHATFAAAPDAPASRRLAVAAPVIVDDWRTDAQASGSALLREHGVVSGMNVVIAGGGRQFGVLGAYTTQSRSFTRDDGNFLCAVANVLAAAIQRKRAEEALQEANRQKDDFLAMLAHELRNPLSPIRNAVQVLRLVGPKEPRLEQASEMIDRQVAHMTRLIDDLLDVSRVARGKISLQRELLDFAALVRTAAEDYRATLEASGLTLILNVPHAPIWVQGDPTRLSQAVGNVLHNANKFTNPGDHVTLIVTVDSDGGTVVLSISDTGIGIEPAVLNRVFDTFTQADQSLDRSRGGLGLGLALVKGLIELHGGTVRAESAGLGKGSQFTIQVPLDREPVRPAAAPAPQRPSRRACRVLIIEDNFDVAESMKMLLEVSGHHVAVAHTGPAGIDAAREFHPQVVLCDLGLPGGMDGYGVARAMRDDPTLRAAYLIALTGYGQEDDRRRVREAGFDMHLIKPVDPASLDQVLASRQGEVGA